MTPIPSERPEDTFTERVIPPYNLYMDDRGIIWKATSAASAVGHFPEWIFEYYNHHNQARLQGATNPDQFRTTLFGQCPELKIVFEVALASKHRFLTRIPGATIPTATDAFIEGDRLTLPNGQFYDDVLERAFNFLRNWLGI